jgi:hypothetical protein
MTNTIRRFSSTVICATVLLLASRGSFAQSTDSIGRANRSAPPTATTPAAPAKYTPMTQRERLHYYVRHMFSIESVVRSAAGAGILQGVDTPTEWGQGADGYGRRFANSYGQHIIRSTLMYGSSAILHEDNRYFRSGKTGFWPRLKYAVASSFLARHEDGSRGVSYSRIGSTVATSIISRSWQPSSTSGPQNAVSSMGTAFGVEVGFNVAREFFPRIFHTRDPVR